MSTTTCTKKINLLLIGWLWCFVAYADFATINGCKIYYETVGKGDAVVLIHGLSLDTRSWDAQWHILKRNHKVIRYDVRGFGQSDRAHDPHNPTEDLKGLLDYLQIQKAHLVGISLGANIALNFAAKYPARVEKIVVADAYLDGFEGYTAQYHAIFDKLVGEASQRGWTDDIQLQWMKSPLMRMYSAPDQTIIKVSEIVADYNGDHFISPKINPFFGSPSTTQLLSSIKTSALILIGERDEESMQKISNLLENNLSDSQKKIIVGAGHLSNLDNPKIFNRMIRGFLR